MNEVCTHCRQGWFEGRRFGEAYPSLELCVQFSDDGQHIRKWSRLPFDGGECLYSHPAPRAEAPSQGVEKIAYAIIEGSGGKRAAEHAREFVTANWEDAMRSAYAVMALSTGQQKGPSQ